MFDVFLDVASIAISAVDFVKKPLWKTAGFLVWDVAATALPFVPGSYTYKAYKLGKSAKAAKKGKKVSKKISNQRTQKANKTISSGSCTKNCFTEETIVQTDNGAKAIKDIKKGDKVLAASDETVVF